ncbi:MAG: CBS domain-containing protein [Syntrophobacteraceae bacterium]
MPVIEPKRMLSELTVREAMRRITVSIPADASIEHVIRCAIKNKINAILTTDDKLEPLGVVSKTDVMGAYYAGISLRSPVRLIMSTPPFYCMPEDTLEQALNIMRTKMVHRLYVPGESAGRGTGVISYPDIVGLLYRYCHRCERNLLRQRQLAGLDDSNLLKVREVMTQQVRTQDEDESLMRVMEALAAHRFGALLITGGEGAPVGVISKTDLVLAYKHGLPPTRNAGTVMRTPVRSCSQEEDLVQAIRGMIFSDIQRVFVYRDVRENIVGVLSLSDAAQARSGSCRACISSRIEVL